MTEARVGVGMTWDGKALNQGVEQAKSKVNSLDKNVHGFSLSLKKVEKAMGIAFAVGLIDKMIGSIKDVVSLSEKGVKLFSDGDLELMKQTNAQIDEMKNAAMKVGATISMYMVGGLTAFSYKLANIVESTNWKEVFFSKKSGVIGGGIALAKGIKEGSKQGEKAYDEALAQAKSNEYKEKGVELSKKLKDMEDAANLAAMTDTEKLQYHVDKIVAARKQYNAEIKNGSKDENFLKEQLIIINEEYKEIATLEDKIAKDEKKKGEDVAKQNKTRQEAIQKLRDNEEEISKIRQKAALIGASFEDERAANQAEQLRVQEEIARAGGEEYLKKRKELEELKLGEEEITQKIKDRNDKAQEIRDNEAEKIDNLSHPKSLVNVAPLAGAAQGMYLGGTDRSGVGRMSRAEKFAEEANKIHKEALKQLKDLNGFGYGG